MRKDPFFVPIGQSKFLWRRSSPLISSRDTCLVISLLNLRWKILTATGVSNPWSDTHVPLRMVPEWLDPSVSVSASKPESILAILAQPGRPTGEWIICWQLMQPSWANSVELAVLACSSSSLADHSDGLRSMSPLEL